MSFDFALFQFNDTAVMTVRDPVDGKPAKDKDGNLVTITLSGADSDLYQKLLSDIRAERIDGRDAMNDAERSSDGLARITIAWSGITYSGKGLSFDYGSAFDLYKRLPWLRQQIEAFISDRRNFIKA